VVKVTALPLYPGKETRYPLYRRLSGPQVLCGRARKISPPTEIRSSERPQPVASCYTDCAIPAPRGTHIFQKSRSHLRILGARRVTRSKARTVDPNVLVATVQNLVVTATCARDLSTFYCGNALRDL
jgi:hypothetical protein